jgi:hypothetical protein
VPLLDGAKERGRAQVRTQKRLLDEIAGENRGRGLAAPLRRRADVEDRRDAEAVVDEGVRVPEREGVESLSGRVEVGGVDLARLVEDLGPVYRRLSGRDLVDDEGAAL